MSIDAMERLDVSPEIVAALADVADERRRQNLKWGEQNHSDEMWLVILSEEFGECARGILEGWPNPDDLDKEIVQIAAAAVAWLECRRRNR